MSADVSEHVLYLPLTLPSGREETLKLYPPSILPDQCDLLILQGPTIHFTVPEGKHINLSTTLNAAFDQSPEEDVFSLRKRSCYQLTGTVFSYGGNATLWIFEYNATRRIDHRIASLQTGPLAFEWETHPDYQSTGMAIRLTGSGSLVLSDLTLKEKGDTGDAPDVGSVPHLTWLIKNPAPNDHNGKKWGDYHFGKGLAKYLERLGQTVHTDYHPNWDTGKRADVVLVLRGIYPYVPKDRKMMHILWNISHPENISSEEYERYDVVCTASRSHAEMLRKKISRPVHDLLQCTDHELFNTQFAVKDEQRYDFIFVGGNYARKRYGVLWALELGVPLKIWGRNWETDISSEHIIQNYIDNDKLPFLYGRAKATLNEHWPDMLQFGFMSNRILDALACGLPVISDYHEDFKKVFPREILFYTNKEELAWCINKVNFSYEDVISKTSAAVTRVHEEFSFKKRAEELMNIVLEYRRK